MYLIIFYFYSCLKRHLSNSMQNFSKIIITGADGWLGLGLITKLAHDLKTKLDH